MREINRDDFNFMPICVDLRDRKVLMVGGGRIALQKTRLLLGYTQSITAVAPEFLPEFRQPPLDCVRLIEDGFDEKYLEGIWLLYVCTQDHGLNHRIRELAAQRRILTSVCDDPAYCDFVSPAVYRQGDLAIAVSSNGKDVLRSIAVRDRIREHVEKDILSLDDDRD